MDKTNQARAKAGGAAYFLVALACTQAGAAGVPPGRIYVPAGADPVQAIYQARLAAMTAELHARWIATGHDGEQTRAATPAITEGTVERTTVTIGVPSAYPTLRFHYRAGAAGLAGITVEFVSPNGKQFYAGQYSHGGYARAGGAEFALTAPLSLYAQPGRWQLYGATIYDNAGIFTSYGQAALATLFSHRSFEVVNTGTVDDVGPRIHGGTLQNDTVSLSARFPSLKANIVASDHGSGLYLGYTLIQPPGQTYSFANIAPAPLPLMRGRLNASNPLNASDPTGTWTITGFAACDFAQNCVGSNNASDVIALYGTNTFNVTP